MESKVQKAMRKDVRDMSRLKERFPDQREVLYVFGAVVFFVYSWAIRGFFYQLSSLLLYHTMGEILTVFSYLMAFALLESMIVMSGLLLLGLLLPPRWFKEGFAYKGFITTLVAGIAMILLNNYLFSLSHAMPPANIIYLSVGISFIVLITVIWIFQNAPRLQAFLLAVQERMQVFIYFYIPLSFLGLIVIVLRNLY